MRLAVWWVEWRLAMASLRRFLVGSIVPLALVVPVATGALGEEQAAAAYLLIFVAYSLVGAAVPLRWEGERGMALRIVRGGVSPASYLLQRSAAGAAIDVVQLAPAIVVAAAGAGASPLEAVATLAVLTLSAWVGTLFGVLVAAWARSVFEAALFAALATLLLGHASGAFRAPLEAGPFARVVESLAPFRALHESLLELTTGTPADGVVALLVWALALPALVALAARGLFSALRPAEPRGLEGI